MPREQGQRFSLVYLERGAPARDSERFRARLAAYYSERLHDVWGSNIKNAWKREAGIPVSFSQEWKWGEVFVSGELRDVLDAITLTYQALREGGGGPLSAGWRNFVVRTLREENVGYVVDERCGVHYAIDEEFERNRTSALAVLDAPRYAAVRAAMEDAYRHMDGAPPDTKAATRSIFESLEILGRLPVPEAKNLSRWLVQNTLKATCSKVQQLEPTGQKVFGGLFAAVGEWVDSIHNYRHGQGTEQPIAPDESTTVHILSTGTSYVRWLAEMDMRLQAQEAC